MTFPPERSDNKIYYRINESVDFVPADNLLRSCVTQQEVIMFTPASNCLKKLIESRGDVVGQRELIGVGWPGGQEKVSLNAFYQTVSHLRKQLQDFLPDQEIITTVKRSGLLISKSVQIQLRSLEAENSPEFPNQSAPAEIISRDKKQVKTTLNYILLLYIIFPVILLGSSYAYYCYSLGKIPPSLLTSFVFYKRLSSGCELYVNKDEVKDLSSNVLYDPRTFNCQGYSRAYVTQWAMRPRSSVVLCQDVNSALGDELQCKTFYYASNHQ